MWVYTAAGERFLDVYNNVPHVGHAHPAVVRAIHAQASRIASNTRYLDETVLELRRAPDGQPARGPGLPACSSTRGAKPTMSPGASPARTPATRGALVMTHAYHGITEAVTALSPALQRFAARRTLSAWPHRPAPRGAARTGAELGAAAGREAQRAIAALSARGFALAAFMVDSAFTSNGIYDPPADVDGADRSGRARGRRSDHRR